MESTFCGFVHTNTRSSKQEDSDHDLNSDLKTSVIKFVKGKWSWTTKKKRKRQLHPQEKKQQLPKNNSGKLVTLEEWIKSSPGLNISFITEGDNLHVSAQASSNGVYPSSFDRNNIKSSSFKSNGSFRLEGLMKLEDINRREVEDSSICCSRSQSGKMKKVSFRLPEVADIFILNSPEPQEAEAHPESEDV